MLYSLAGLTALAFMAPVAAAPQQPAHGASTARSGDIDRILAATAAPDVVVQVGLQGFQAQFDKEFASDSTFKSMDAAYPGILAALKADLDKTYSALLRENIPAFHQKLAAVYAQSLTPADLKATADFYESPTGKKMTSGAMRAQKQAVIASSTPSKLDPNIAKAAKSGLPVDAVTVSSDDISTLVALNGSPLGPKIIAMQPSLKKAQEDWVNGILASEGSKIQAATVSSLQAYMEAHPAAPATVAQGK